MGGVATALYFYGNILFGMKFYLKNLAKKSSAEVRAYVTRGFGGCCCGEGCGKERVSG